MASLRSRTISGMIWSLLQGIGGRGVSFIVTIILARILTPDIFGLIGMLAIFMEVSGVLVVAGFNEALIQKSDADEEDYSTVFWLNLLTGLIVYSILFYCGPLISSFYNQPVLTNLVRILSLVFIINAFSYVQETRLRKALEFRTLMLIHLPSVCLSGVVGVIMAVKGYGVWSLVIMELVSRVAYTIQISIYSRWRPLFCFKIGRARQLFSFGGKLLISGILSKMFQNAYLLVLGKFFPLSSVGYYQTARKMVIIPSSTLGNALNSVAFPVFSSIQSDNKRLKEGYKKIIKQVFFWVCPIFIFSGVLALPLFRFIFTEKWVPAVPYFRILCIVGILYPLNLYNLNIVNVKGRSDLFLKLGIVKKVIKSLGIIVAIRYGIWALIGFQALDSLFAYFLNSYYSGRFIQYSVFEQIKDVLPIFISCLTIGCMVLIVDASFSGFPDILRLLVGYGIGLSSYMLVARIIHLDPYSDFVEILQTRSRFFFKA